MTTANATTNENGYRMIGGTNFGNTIPKDEMYSDKIGSKVNWKFKRTERLSILKYDKDQLVGIGAMRLSDSYANNFMSNCHVYDSETTRHTAVHCPDINRVIIVKPKGGYVIRNDESFTGKKYK